MTYLNRGSLVKELWKVINTFLNHRLDRTTRTIYLLVFANALLGLVLLTINHFSLNYTGNNWFTAPWQRMIAPLLFLSAFIVYFEENTPKRLNLFMFTFIFYCLSLAAGLILTAGIQVTPFAAVDHQLLHFNQMLGFNQKHFMALIHSYPLLHSILMAAYSSLTYQLLILPLLMAYLMREREVKVFLLAMLIVYPIGGLIYYFFPTTTPSVVIHSPYFIDDQYIEFLRFYQVHHHLKLTVDAYAGTGLITLPSFHVIWSIFLTYMVRNKKWLFYPLLVWNSFLILSTVALGCHYLIDVIVAAIIAVGVLSVTEYLYYRLNLKKGSQLAQNTSPQIQDATI
jgi:hypothetical protein